MGLRHPLREEKRETINSSEGKMAAPGKSSRSKNSAAMAIYGTFPAVLLVSLLTYACAGVQLYCATRCIRLSRTA